MNTNRMHWVWGAALALLLTAAAVVVTPQTSQAANAAADAVPGVRQQRGGVGAPDDGEELLADALGISVEELQAAHEQAVDAAIDQALEEGLITELQAEQLRQRSNRRLPRFFPGWTDSAIDPDALLAEALGIEVDDLNAARTEAREAALALAVEEGRLTQEQADGLQALQTLQPYLRDRMQSALEDAVAQAVADGAITQEQADQILEEAEEGRFFRRGFHDFGARHGMRGFGGFGPRGHRGGEGFPGRFQRQPDGTSNQNRNGVGASVQTL